MAPTPAPRDVPEEVVARISGDLNGYPVADLFERLDVGRWGDILNGLADSSDPFLKSCTEDLIEEVQAQQHQRGLLLKQRRAEGYRPAEPAPATEVLVAPPESAPTAGPVGRDALVLALVENLAPVLQAVAAAGKAPDVMGTLGLAQAIATKVS